MASNGTVPAWIKDKQWSDQLLPAIKRILGEHLLMAAPREEDIERATDLMSVELVLPSGLRVACRVRRAAQLRRDTSYGEQFTIRSKRPNGVKCELAKIVEGWGSHLFYGFADEDLVCWLLGDLSVFRLWFLRYLASHGGEMPGEDIPNRDGSSRFLAIPIEDLPPAFVIARQMPPDDLRWHGGYAGVLPVDLSEEASPATETLPAYRQGQLW